LIEKPRSRVSLTLEATIWNVLPVPSRPWVVIEERNDETRQVSFLAYDYREGKITWRSLLPSEPWWINLVQVTADFVFLKAFENTSNPDKTKWHWLSIIDGKQLESIPVSDSGHTNEVIHPFQYLEDEEDFNTVRFFVEKKLNVHPVSGVEYVEYAELIFISFYLGSSGMFANHLACFTKAGILQWQEEIGTNLKGIGVNTFFLVSDHLFFVKNKTELVTFGIV